MTHRSSVLSLLLTVVAGSAPGFAAAMDPFGFYIGGAVGRAAVEVDQVGTVPLEFDKQHVGWKLLFGVRPVSVLGAEFDYINFGHPSTVIANNVNTDEQMRGPAVFALGYLLLPLPFLDVYGKVGLARLQTSATASLRVGLGAPCNPSHPYHSHVDLRNWIEPTATSRGGSGRR